MIQTSRNGAIHRWRPYVYATVIELLLFGWTVQTFHESGGLHSGGSLMFTLLLTQLPGILIGGLLARAIEVVGITGGYDATFLTAVLVVQLSLICGVVRTVRRSRYRTS
jgi:hypothetical protein